MKEFGSKVLEYEALFPITVQYGRLYVYRGESKGSLSLWIVPDQYDFCVPPWECPDAVQVFGPVLGRNGVLTYGWIHHGKWVQDFARIVENRRAEIRAEEDHKRAVRDEQEEFERRRILKLLATYE